MHRKEEESDWCQVPAINMLMNSFSCLFLFIRGGCRESWVFRTPISSLQAADIMTLDNISWLGAQISPLPLSHHFHLSVIINQSEASLSKPITHNKAISMSSAFYQFRSCSWRPHFSSCVSFTPPASGERERERVSSSVFRPGCSQHSVVAPSSNFNHNVVHLGALKTSQSVVFPHQSL